MLAGVLAWIRRPRLVVVVPKLFTYSNLSERGQLAEITIFNRGFKTEEAVELSLNPSLQYNLVGANSQDISLTRNKLTIFRIGPGDEVGTVLLVEGGAFSKSDISNCLSKETKGRVVASLDRVPPTGPQRIHLIALLFFVPVVLYSFTMFIDYISEYQPLADKGEQASLKGWSTRKWHEQNSLLFGHLRDGRIQLTIGTETRKKDIVTVPIRVVNNTSSPIKYTAEMTTSGSDVRIPSYDRRVYDVLVMPGATSERGISVVVPILASNPSDKLIYIDLYLETAGDSLKLTKIHAVD